MSKEIDLFVSQKESGNTLEAENPSDIRTLTSMLGLVAEEAVLNIGLVKQPEILDTKSLGAAALKIRKSLDAEIGLRRLEGLDLSIAFLSVIKQNQPQVEEIYKAADLICRTCQINDPGLSFQAAFGKPSGLSRYWLEAALILTTEAVEPPLLQLPHDWTCLLGETAVGLGTVKFDGLIVPRGGWNGEQPTFTAIQKQSEPWWTIEVKTLFSWWRNVGKAPLERPPRNILKQIDERLERAARWAVLNTDDYFPPIGEWLLLLRGWRESLAYVRPWHSCEWQLVRRDDRLGDMFWYE